MPAKGVLSRLVQHDLKWRLGKRRPDGRPSMSRGWKMVYLVFGLIVVSGLATYAGIQESFRLAYTWYLTFWLPFIALVWSIVGIHREWKNGTIGWWLSLPYARSKLITAKFLASLVKTVIIFAGVYGVMALYAFYTVILSTHIGVNDAVGFLATGLKWFPVLIATTPFIAAFGILMGIVNHSRSKPAEPLLWIVFWIGGNLFIGGWIESHVSPAGTFVPPFSGMMLAALGVSWIVAWLMIRVSSYVLDRKLAL